MLGTAMMLIGENSRAVALDVADKVDEIQASLPEGVLIQSVYDRTALVDKPSTQYEKTLLKAHCWLLSSYFYYWATYELPSSPLLSSLLLCLPR